MRRPTDGSILASVLRECWTRDRVGTNLSFEFDGVTGSIVLWCQDSPGGHVTTARFEMPALSDSLSIARYAEEQVAALLASHREPWNRMRGVDLPGVAAATYCLDGS